MASNINCKKQSYSKVSNITVDLADMSYVHINVRII